LFDFDYWRLSRLPIPRAFTGCESSWYLVLPSCSLQFLCCVGAGKRSLTRPRRRTGLLSAASGGLFKLLLLLGLVGLGKHQRFRRQGLAVEAYQTTAVLLKEASPACRTPRARVAADTREVRADPRVGGSDLTSKNWKEGRVPGRASRITICWARLSDQSPAEGHTSRGRLV
jgi:hypothetical protein